uniref:Uncharacterized protein n=1 Tax=Wuchereria bancrofti TaxID=6293 RepID=A0AAF5PKR7_WUCBA
MAVSAVSDEEIWYYDEALELSDEEFTDFFHIKDDTTHQWQRCPISVLDALCGTILKLLLFSALKLFLVFLHAREIVSKFTLYLTFVASGLFIIGTQNNLSSICIYIVLTVVFPYYNFLFNKQTKFVMLAYSIGILLVWQYFFTAKEFMSMRGILMIVLMKITSLSFDLANELYGNVIALTICLIVQLYCLAETLNFFRGFSYIVLSLLAVIRSSCIADSFIFPAGTSLLSGIDSGIVTDWIHIELSRSLVDVVVSWNISMHRFLHQYIFGETRKYGSAAGINFQLSAVLLSLGLYTYAETKVRSKLSCRTDSCVRARICRKECHHTCKEFRALALTHLVYLGTAFDGSTAETGYSWIHTLSLWADLYYFSHVIGLFMLLLSSAF